MRPHREQLWVRLGWMVVQLSACTLTSDDFEPRRVEAVPLEQGTTSSESEPAAPMPKEPVAPAVPPSAPDQPEPVTTASCSSPSSEQPACQLLRQQAQPANRVECSSPLDCASHNCRDGSCVPASCSDGILNQDEADADCAGACPTRCVEGQHCDSSADCAATLFCAETTTRCTLPSCQDGVQNGRETGRDCGGDCTGCAAGSACTRSEDCATGVCSDGSCASASCDDLVRNQNETDIDCGGPCAPCGPGLSCALDADCGSGACQDGTCCGGNELDCVRCARRLATSLNCASNGASAELTTTCNAFLQCLADHPASCPRRFAAGCADAGSVCDEANYGGNGSSAVTLADGILGTAQCNF
jgi:hypothetical protein